MPWLFNGADDEKHPSSVVAGIAAVDMANASSVRAADAEGNLNVDGIVVESERRTDARRSARLDLTQ